MAASWIILDPNGAVVAGATVMLRSDTAGIEQTVVSDASGQYRFLLVPAGQYTLSVQAAGFGRFIDKGISLTVGQIANLPITLQLTTATSEVSVTTDASIVETQRTSVATTVDQTRIDNLPINARNAGTKSYTLFTDLRLSRRLHLGESMSLDAVMDTFNVLNRFNVADVNPLYTQAGTPTSVRSAAVAVCSEVELVSRF